MNRSIVRMLAVVSAAMLVPALAGRVYADDTKTDTSKSFRGVVRAVDEQERTITVRGLWLWPTRTFRLGDESQVSLEDNQNATLKDLRLGHRVKVQYHRVGGINVANQVAQKDVTFTGYIAALDPADRTLTLKRGSTSRKFITAKDCRIVIRGDEAKALSELTIGSQTTVSYRPVDGVKVAHKTEHGSMTFSGTVEAIDAGARTLKAQHLLSEKKFVLAKDCQIVINGKLGGQLNQLRIGDKVMLHYANVDGVLVADRLSNEGSPMESMPSQVTKVGEPGPE